MYNGKLVAVVVPCYNEETQIGNVIDTMPDFVDRIVVVDDGSRDRTAEVIKDRISSGTPSETKIVWRKPTTERTFFNRAELVYEQVRVEKDKLFPAHTIINDNDTDRLVLVCKSNGRKGTAIAVGYKWCRDHNIDVTLIMDGDGQMDPAEMEDLIKPIIFDGVDYTKGNRLIHRAASAVIPKERFLGNAILSLLTKIASGYWRISDTQTGYTAISHSALERIPIHAIYKDYGCPNDILIKLNIANCIICEVPIKPVYNVGEKSKMKIKKVIFTVSWLLLKGFVKRICYKYILWNFHPLSLLYIFSFFSMILNIPFVIDIIYKVVILGKTSSLGVYIAFMLLASFGFQSLCFGMWMDVQDNDKLQK